MKPKETAIPRFAIVGLIVSAIVLVALMVTARAQSPQQAAQAFSGTFESSVDEKKAEAKIDQEIDDVVSQMNFIKRPFARRQLKKATNPCDTLRFQPDGGQLTIKCNERPAATAPLDGSQAVYEDAEGERFVLAMKAGGQEVVQVFASEDGTRTNRYSLGPDGQTLTMETTVESDQLPEPLVYDRAFERVQ